MASIIKFQPGQTEVVALKFDEGKNVEGKFGPQVAFSTIDDRMFYLDPTPADDVETELRKFGIKAGTPFKLTKVKTSHGGSRFTVEPIAARGDEGGHNVPGRARYSAPAPGYWDVEIPPTPAAQPVAAPAPAAQPSTSAVCMMAAMCAAVDAVIETQAYATRRGLGVTFSEESVRAIGLSIYISNCKGGR
jgi:hypothetical protein